MSQFNSLQLLQTLKNDLQALTTATEQLLAEADILNTAPAPGKWSIAQVLEHLNFYHDFYLPEIEQAFKQRPKSINTSQCVFSTGLMGGYLTKMMRPDAAGKVSNKTKALKDYIPAPQLDAEQVLSRFLESQQRFSKLLDQARFYDLNKVRIPMSISKLIRLKLGDLLRVLVIHQQRHLIQINEAKEIIMQHRLQKV